jgi:DNA repair protein RecN (Recombination protein N)
MLRQLSVRDFALVRALDIDFDAGLSVITGESGAGKSILLGALGMVTGDRADTANIRPGADRSEVAAEFTLDTEAAVSFLTERGLVDPDQPERCLLRRVLSREGRSRAFINGSPVTRQELAALTAHLIDIHGQHEHQSLLRADVQLSLLDDFGSHAADVAAVRRDYRAWQQHQRDLDDVTARLAHAEARQALLEYQVAELDELALAPGEYEELDGRYRRLAKRQDIEQQVAAAMAALDGEDGGGIDALNAIARVLNGIRDDHDALTAARDLIQTALTHAGEAAAELRRYGDALTLDPAELLALEARVERAVSLARKHRVRPEQLADLHAGLQAELGALTGERESQDSLTARVTALATRFREAATKLGRARRTAAAAFEREVSEHMERLGIKGGRLAVSFVEHVSESGLEAVEYHIVTNPKYPAAPLARIASGGEQSRISLAIQVVAAARTRMPTLVLDEADVGIGGTTADVVGRMLRQIAHESQVLCVTHAPQVAALGDQHLHVSKDPEQDTRIAALDSEARVGELARMLGGRSITAKTRAFARELIAAAAAPAS